MFKNLKIVFHWKQSESLKTVPGLEIGSDALNRSLASHQNKRISIHVQTWVNFMEKYTIYWEIHPVRSRGESSKRSYCYHMISVFYLATVMSCDSNVTTLESVADIFPNEYFRCLWHSSRMSSTSHKSFSWMPVCCRIHV